MTNKNDKDNSMGPQGTQFFELDAVNQLIAEGITESQSEEASIPAFVGVSSNVSGQRFILNKDKLQVGRRNSSDIALNVSSVSAMHAQVIKQDDYWKVLNLLSSNGTFVNGKKVVEEVIMPGDRIAFAGAEFVFTMIDEPRAQKGLNKNISLMFVAASLLAAFGGLLYYIV